jgi:hypothetical protein
MKTKRCKTGKSKGGAAEVSPNLPDRTGREDREHKSEVATTASPLSAIDAYSLSPEDYMFAYDPGLRQVNHEIWHSAPNGTISHNVFVVHGHDEAAKVAVTGFLEDMKLNAIVLEREPNIGSYTIMEKFLHYSSSAVYAVVLLTADDANGHPRPNVLFEFGYFVGKLGRDHVCLLKGKGVEMPSDLHGVLYIELDSNAVWERIAREMKRAGLRIDLNLMRSA